ncbi:MAG: diguanylate cyclase [Bdellovibrionales bacterium]
MGENHNSDDALAGLALTPEQHAALEALRQEASQGRARIEALEQKVHELELGSSAPDHPAILTRSEFNREVARMLACDERYGGVSSVLYFDIEKLDAAIEKFGKSVANAALREATLALMKHVRGSDIVGRLAPTEFGVLLVRCGNSDAWRKSKELAGHLYDALVEVHGCRLELDVGYGAYTFRAEEDVATGLREAANAVTKSLFTR